MVFFFNGYRMILCFGGAQTAVAGIVLAVDIGDVPSEHLREALDHRGINAFVFGERFFDMID